MTTLDGCIDGRSYHYVFLCFRRPPAPQKRENRPNSPLFFVELEKKGTAGGRSASERGEEPRSGTLSTSPLFSCFRHPPVHKKRPPFCGLSLWSWRRKEPPVAVPPASEAKSRGAEHSQLLPSSYASDSLQLIKKNRHSAVFLCGAGGSRTLVQTSDRCAFYMLIP